jgi:DsbC/DsbD-like thiol-disulfide interchange protein
MLASCCSPADGPAAGPLPPRPQRPPGHHAAGEGRTGGARARRRGAGKPLWLGLLIEHQPHWHTYWKNPGDSGLPTTLEWQLPPGHGRRDPWPTPGKLPIGPLMNFGYEGTLLLPVPCQLAGRSMPARA